MSDPRESDPLPPPEERRRGVHPLIWVLLLIALAALGWWFYNHNVRTGRDIAAPSATAPAPEITSEQEAAAQAERERAEANERRRAERRARERARTDAARRPADREVEPIARVQPEYPPAAARLQEEGTVMVRVEVDASGTPTGVSIARRSGSRELDRAALQAVRQWRFRPAIRDGKPAASVVEVPVEFTFHRQ